MAVAVVFGVVLSAVKGNGAGIRSTIGNTSAPWLLLPLLAAAATAGGRPRKGVVVGTVVSLTALLAFYAADTVVLDLGSHPWLTDLRLAIEAGRLYFALALVSGPVFGAFGSLVRRRPPALALVMALLLVLEPLAWLGYEALSPVRFANHPVVWAVEGACGLVVGLAIAKQRPAVRR